MTHAERDPLPVPESSTHLQLRAGYTLALTEVEQAHGIQLIAPDGKICLNVRLTEQGPLLEVDGISLFVRAERDFHVECENLDLRARSSLSLHAGSDLRQSAQGDIELRARLGEVRLEANDDVTLEGESIRLNSPKLRGRHQR